MSNECCVCGKRAQYGHNVSHANNKTQRIFQPNLQTVKAVLPSRQVKKIKVCTGCIKSGKIQKAV